MFQYFEYIFLLFIFYICYVSLCLEMKYSRLRKPSISVRGVLGSKAQGTGGQQAKGLYLYSYILEHACRQSALVSEASCTHALGCEAARSTFYNTKATHLTNVTWLTYANNTDMKYNGKCACSIRKSPVNELYMGFR